MNKKLKIGIVLLCSWFFFTHAQKIDSIQPFDVTCLGNVTEFYFVRHGQTDHNIGLIKQNMDVPLNAVGRQQAEIVKLYLETLPIKTICFSPLCRAEQTKNIINADLKIKAIAVADLKEGAVHDFYELQRIKNKQNVTISKSLNKFLNRLWRGLQKSLRQTAPVLIVAHGGVYSALCRILDITTDEWAISNCTVMRFYKKPDGTWAVQKLFDLSAGNAYDPTYLQHQASMVV